MVCLLLQSCAEIQPSTRLATCNNWGRDCVWHDVGTGQVVQLTPQHFEQGAMSNDANNGNVGNNDSYMW